MAIFSPSGRRSGCFPAYLSHPRTSRSRGSLYRTFRCVLCDWRKRLEHVSASSRSTGVFFTRARRVRAFWPPRVHVVATSSPLSELRLERQRGVGATDAWRQICGPPRTSRRRLRYFRWLEQVETEGGKLSARECAAQAKEATCGGQSVHRRWDEVSQEVATGFAELEQPEPLAGCPPSDDSSSLLNTCVKSQEKSTS